MVSAEDGNAEESMMDIAERYLGELAKRCIVHVTMKISPSARKFDRFRLHDLMRDLCLAKASEENFLKVINSTSSSGGNLHRIVIRLSEEDAEKYAPPEIEVTKHLRTFSFFHTGGGGNLIAQLADSQLNRFQMLRSLIIEGVIPHGVYKLRIGNLIHLRYLSLKESTLLVSPSSISKLEHLEILDLRHAKITWTRDVPLRMGQLRYLDISYLGVPFFQIYASSNLEILRGYDPECCDVRDFFELINLRELELQPSNRTFRAEVEKALKCISKFPKLKHARIWAPRVRNLTADLAQLFSSNPQTLDLCVSLDKLPKFDSHFFRNLEDLQLQYTYLEEDPMEVLEKLPNLQRLWLGGTSFMGKEMVCHSMGFPQLRFLQLRVLPDLKKWTVEKGAMPNLSRLEIDSCGKLTMIPEGLRFIKPLKELDIDDMPEEFGNRIRVVDGQKGEDFDKISHIPSIVFNGSPLVVPS